MVSGALAELLQILSVNSCMVHIDLTGIGNLFKYPHIPVPPSPPFPTHLVIKNCEMFIMFRLLECNYKNNDTGPTLVHILPRAEE